MASSSSSHQEKKGSGPFGEFERKAFPASRKLFDAFINHRGPDVKETVAAALHKSLKEKECRAFLDDREFEIGDPIISTIENAILSSRVQIAIFSPRYAESSWCLDELVLMLNTKARFIPIFCDVEPSHLRYLKTGAYGEAFKNHEEKGRFSKERIRQWKEALEHSSLISGHRYNTSHDDVQRLCTKIAEAVQKEVENTRCLEVAKHPVALDQLVEDFERQIGDQAGDIVGILAMGGSGKTTLAKEFFNRKRSNYGASSFVFDVREASAKDELQCLQSQLLKDLFREDHKFRNVDEGTPILRDRMGRTRNSFLIVLDDVNHQKQLDALLVRRKDDLVIVTTRDERVLTTAGITNCYRLKEMDGAHGKQLFCWNAFDVPIAPQRYETLVNSFVDLCGGLPLSIQVSSGNLYGVEDIAVWQSELEKFRSTLHLDITDRLKLSFDRLDREQKLIFMDIACFFIGTVKSIGVRIWKGSGLNAEHTVQILKDKCLIETEWKPSVELLYDDPLVFKMHDHLRDLGREMADQHKSPIRLWRSRDLNSLKTDSLKDILTKTQNQRIRCFSSIFDTSFDCYIKYFIGDSDDHQQPFSELLWIKVDLVRYKPNRFHPAIHVEPSRIICGCFRRLWHEDIQVPSLLKELQLNATPFLYLPKELRMLNELGMLNNLEDLVIVGNLPLRTPYDGAFLSESLMKLTNLTRLVLRSFKLQGELTLSSCGYPGGKNVAVGSMNKLRSVEIDDVSLVSKVIISGEYCSSLEKLVLANMPDLMEVHLSRVKSIKFLMLRGCGEIMSVSGNLDQGKLEEMIIHDCPHLKKLPDLTLLSCLDSIQVKNSFNLPVNENEDLEELEYLHLSNGRYSATQYVMNRELKSKTLYRTVSNRGIWTRIRRLTSLPSKAITLIGRAADGAESILNRHLFSGIVSSADAVAEVPREGNDNSELPVKMLDTVSVIIVSSLIHTLSTGDVVIRLGPERVSSRLEPGQWIITIVLTGQKNLEHGREFIAYPYMFFSGCRTKKSCTVKTGEEGSALPIVQKIVRELYMESSSDS